MSVARTTLSWATTVAATPVLATAAILAHRIAGAGVSPHRVAHAWARLLLAAAGVKITTAGPRPSATAGPLVLMSNHLSSVDIPVLLAGLDPSLRPGFLAKTSLFSIPFLGGAMSALGCVAVDRENTTTARRTLDDARAELRRGRSMIAFPEGTWGPGDELLPFHRGPFLLALRARVAILPVALDGPQRVLPPSALRVAPGPVTIRFGPLMDTGNRRLSDLDGLIAEVRQEIAILVRES